MYAVIAHSGKQYRVSEDDLVDVDRISAEVGSTFDITEVLLVSGDDVKIGTPKVDGAAVTVEVISHDLGEKRDVFKYRSTHRSRVRRGFRPATTRLRVQRIQA